MRELKIAIKKMQRFAGLPETGLITDPKALAMVKRTRCGLSDFGPSDLARRKRRYAIQGTKWRKQVGYLTFRGKSKIEEYSQRTITP